jgi:hypothetical protein
LDIYEFSVRHDTAGSGPSKRQGITAASFQKAHHEHNQRRHSISASRLETSVCRKRGTNSEYTADSLNMDCLTKSPTKDSTMDFI